MSEFQKASDWSEEWDETYQCYFFYNSVTGESSWERPEGLPESEDAKEINATVGKTMSTSVESTEITPELVEEAAKWTVAWDDNYEAEFYIHSDTGESSWEMPQCLVALQSQAETQVESNEKNEAARADPANWCVEWDSSFCCEFFYNKVTDESSWERPACLEDIGDDKAKGGDNENEFVKEEEEQDDDQKEREDGTGLVQPIKNDSLTEIKRPTRKNSVMRRPSTRPGTTALKRTSVLLSSSIPPPPPPRNDLPTDEVSTESTKTNAATSSKRRQSLAPRPSTLPPKPIVLRPEFHSQMSSLFENVDGESTKRSAALMKSESNVTIIEGDEDEDDNEEDENESNKKLDHTEVINDLTARLGVAKVETVDVKVDVKSETETAQDQPKAIGTYMMKKSPALLKGWQKRYVTIKEGKLSYYANVSLVESDS